MRDLVDTNFRRVSLGKFSNVSKGLRSSATGISDTFYSRLPTGTPLGFRARNYRESEHRSSRIGTHRDWEHRYSGNSGTLSLGIRTPTLWDLGHATGRTHRDLMHGKTANLRPGLDNPPRNSDLKNLDNNQQHQLMSFIMEKGNV